MHFLYSFTVALILSATVVSAQEASQGPTSDRTIELNKKNLNTAGASFSQKAYMPDISLIMDAGYVSRDLEDARFAEAYLPGFQEAAHDHAEDEGHSHGIGERGFHLNYGELTLASTVDPMFDLVAIFHLTEEDFAIEEMFATTRGLPLGLQAKLGKFYSSFGRINSQHAHSWDFTDKPLVYDMLLGPEGLLDTGVQINWLAPTDTYLLFGVEAFNGDNGEGSFARDGFAADIEGDERTFEKRDAPSTFVLFMKSSVDIGGLSLLGGASYALGTLQLNEGEEAVDANSRVLGLELLAKYYFNSYSSIAWQTEYLDRHINGDNYFVEEHGEEHADEEGEAHDHGSEYTGVESMMKNHAGIYSQLLFRLDQNLAFGGRYESLFKNDVSLGGVDQDFETDLTKWSLMAQWNWSEFSYTRLQYNHDRTKFIDGAREPVTEVIMQFNFTIGAHPAHSF